MKLNLSDEEILRAVVMVAKIDPDLYAGDAAKALIYKCRDIVIRGLSEGAGHNS